MLLKYNRPNVHTIPSHDGRRSYTLRPGWNQIPKDHWESLKKDPELNRFVEERILEVSDFKKESKRGSKTVSKSVGHDDAPIILKELKESEAIRLVKDTFDREQLQVWLDAETRTKVKRALEKQIKPLLPGSQEEGE